jgi:UDP-GlcNAc:undecaprenyl-phosphate GlcNAc-1-phosphate transferase
MSLTCLFLLSAVFSFLLTPICRNVSVRLGFLDCPNDSRKIHRQPVPRVGGIPMLVACGLSLGLLALFNPGADYIRYLSQIGALLPSISIIITIGLIDDLLGLKPWQKLLGASVAAALVCAAGVHVTGFGGWRFPHWAAFPVTTVWLIGCANAVNLIDGLDGLAAGVGLVASLTMLAAALMQGNLALALVTTPLAGALCGFLRYNFNRASIFLGDCGSLSLGFLLGVYGIIWSQKSATVLGMTAPVLTLALPLLDTALTIVRRGLRGTSIFSADRRHIHHLLLDRGLTPRRVVLLLYGLCGLGAILSLLVSFLHGRHAGMVLVFFCAVVWAGIQRLGYMEFDVAGRLIHPRTLRRTLDAQIRLHLLEEALAAAETIDDCLVAIRRTSQELGFSHLSMRLDHTVYEDYLNDCENSGPRLLGTGQIHESANCWTLHVPISETEFVRLGHVFQNALPTTVVAALADLLRRSLEPKLALFRLQTDRCPVQVKAAAAS